MIRELSRNRNCRHGQHCWLRFDCCRAAKLVSLSYLYELALVEINAKNEHLD